MKLWKIPLLCLVVLFDFQAEAQTGQNWEDFVKTHKADYIYLAQNASITNFSCLITTAGFINYAAQLGDSSYKYPLKLLWTREGKIFYILQPYPDSLTALQRADLIDQIKTVKLQFRGFFMDWQNFLIFSPFSDIPGNADILWKSDSISVSYKNGEGASQAAVQKYFSPGGLLLRVNVITPTQTIATYPYYKEANGRWLCQGWNSQIYEKGAISGGLAARLGLTQVNNNWMPERAEMLIQSSQKPEEQFVNTIFLKDFIFNLNVQTVPSPTGTNQPSQK